MDAPQPAGGVLRGLNVAASAEHAEAREGLAGDRKGTAASNAEQAGPLAN